MFGKTFEHTDEAKEKIRIGLTEYSKNRPEKHQKALDWTGREHTEETKRLIGLANNGVNRPRSEKELERLGKGLMTGKSQSDHQKATVAKALSKDWKIITPDGKSFIVTNLRKWAKENGLDQANLARGGNGSHKGYRAIRQ